MKKIEMNGVAEVELSYKSKIKPENRIQIKDSKSAYDIFKGVWNENTIEYFEEFKMLIVNRANFVLGILTVSKGGTSGTVSDIRIIFQAAIKANAAGIIVAHNHPSGNLNPSESDIQLTKKIKEAGRILDIQLLDHLIITPFNYYSLADEGHI